MFLFSPHPPGGRVLPLLPRQGPFPTCPRHCCGQSRIQDSGDLTGQAVHRGSARMPSAPPCQALTDPPFTPSLRLCRHPSLCLCICLLSREAEKFGIRRQIFQNQLFTQQVYPWASFTLKMFISSGEGVQSHLVPALRELPVCGEKI